MSGESASFNFESNVNEFVTNMEAKLNKLNTVIAESGKARSVFPRTAINDSLAGFQQVITKIKELNELLASGGINKADFTRQYRDLVRGSFTSLQQELSGAASKLSLDPGARKVLAQKGVEAARVYAEAYKAALPPGLAKAAFADRTTNGLVASVGKLDYTARAGQITDRSIAAEIADAERIAAAYAKVAAAQAKARAAAELGPGGPGIGPWGTLESEAQRYTAAVEKAKAAQSELLRRERITSLQSQIDGDPLASFVNRAGKGTGNLASGLAAQAASAAEFTLSYGAIFGAVGVVKDTVKQFLEYQEAVTDTDVAMQGANGVTQEWVNSLSDLARVAGENVGVALNSAAQGIRAFAPPGATVAEKQQIGTATNYTSTQLALISNQSQKDATGDVIASASAFGLLPSELNQVTDAVANAKRYVGGDAKDIAEGLSHVAITAKQAGYSMSEAAAVIGIVQTRTGQTGETIASGLSRIFAITNGSSGQRLATELSGLEAAAKQAVGDKHPLALSDPNASTKDRLSAFADIYSTADPAVRNQISSTLGGTRNLQFLTPLLTDNKTLQDAFAKSLKNAGQGEDEFNRKSENLVGTLKKIKGDLDGIAVATALSGIAAPFGLLTRTLEPALYALDRMLQILDELPKPLREVGGFVVDATLLALAFNKVAAAMSKVAALRAAKTGEAVASAASAAGATGAAGVSEAQAATNAATLAKLRASEGRAAAILDQRSALVEQQAAAVAAGTASQERLAALEQEVAAADGALVRAIGARAAAEALAAEGAELSAGASTLRNRAVGGVAATGGALLESPGLLAGIAAFAGIAAIGYTLEQDQKARALFDTSANSNGDYQRIGNTSESLAQAALDFRDTAKQLEKQKNGGDSADQKNLEDVANARARGIEELAKELSNLASTEPKMSAFGNGAVSSMQQVADGMASLGQQGATTVQQINAALDALNTPPPKSPTWTNKTLFADLYKSLGANINDAVTSKSGILGVTKPFDFTAGTGGIGTSGDPKELQQLLLAGGAAETKAMRAALDAELKKRGLKPGDKLTAADKQSLLTAIASADPGLQAFNPGAYSGAYKDLPNGGDFRQTVLDSWIKNGLGTFNKLKSQQLPKDALNSTHITPSQLDSVLWQGGANDAQGNPIVPLQQLFQNGLQSLPKSDDGTQARQFMRNFIKGVQERVKAAGGAANQSAETLQVIADMEHDLTQSIVNNLDAMRKVAESHAKTQAQLQSIRIKAATGEFEKTHGDQSIIDNLLGEMDQKTVDAVRANVASALALAKIALQKQQEMFAEALALAALDPFSGVDPQAITAAMAKAAKKVDSLTAVQDGLAKGIKTTPLTGAAATLAKSAGETADQLNQAKEAYDSAMRQLGSDLTDPVVGARNALADAKEKLRLDTSAGDSKDIIAGDKVGVKTTETSLEKARFDQKFSDMQTAEQLGRIGEATYLNYLRNEHNRLQGIAHKSRQQIDELNQVDQALQSAYSSMNAQFNLGNIDTKGLVYAARRYGQQVIAPEFSAGHAAASSGAVNSNNIINFNGADFATIKKILAQMFGAGHVTQTTRGRRVGVQS